MNITDIIRLYSTEFERYDRQNRDYTIELGKLERFYNYLNKLQSVCKLITYLIEASDIPLIGTDNGRLKEHEVSCIHKTVKQFIRNEEKRIAAAAQSR